jgi:hypothetical protein
MKAKIGALAEYQSLVPADTRSQLGDLVQALDLRDIDDISKMHHLLVLTLIQGNVSPEVSAEIREVLTGATTLAAAKAQGIFDSEDALDGVMALAAAAENARSRRRERNNARNVIEADD